ncbi:MAG: cell division protein FtsQ/DivIB [Acidimicrobiales bacterium]
MSRQSTVPAPPVPLPGAVDPRLRQRLVEVRRQQGRRRLMVIGAISFVSVAVATGWAVTRSPVMDVDRITVVGDVNTSPAAVARSAGLHLGQAIVDVDESAAARRMERVPWVRLAYVRRRWPATVVVTLVERVPVAVVAPSGGPQMLVDATGRVLAEASDQVGERQVLPMLLGLPRPGPPGSQLRAPGDDVLAVATAISPALAAHLEGVAPAAGGGVELRLRPSGTVRFGKAIQVDEKLAAVSAVLSGADMSNLVVLDVRIPQTPVLTRAGSAGKVSTEAGA